MPDFRTIGEVEVGQASPDLLDTIYQCQQRQEWYRDYARCIASRRSPSSASLTTDVEVVEAAVLMRAVLGFEPAERGASWGEAARRLDRRGRASRVYS